MEASTKTSLSGLIARNLTTYKITVSIIFGLLGFVINLYSISFSFPPYTATVLIGLLFPMLITRTWGWKYGLLSALAGGCQSIWWLWGPSNGYAVFLVVPPFTLWVVWHGLCAELRNKRKNHKWWLSAYAVEIPFRILSTISLLTLARWAITFNPPSWSWASSASNTIPLQFSVFVAVKQFVIGYIILLLADVLLNFRFIRRFFILEKKGNHANTGYVISASLLFGVLFWIIDSFLGCLIFHPENTFFDLLALNIPLYIFYIRIAFILACLTGGVLVSKFLRKKHESKEALRKQEAQLRAVLDNTIIHVWSFDGVQYLYQSKEWYRYTGQDPDLPRTIKRWTEVIHPDDVDETVKSWLKAWNSKGIYDDHFRIKNTNSEYRLFHSHAVPIYDENGNFQHYQGYNIDVTEQKRVEEDLRESESKHKRLHSMLRLMSDNLPDLIWTKDIEGKFLFVNKACSEILLDAKNTDEPIGKTDTYFAERMMKSHPEIPDYLSFGKKCVESDLTVLTTKKPMRFDESGNVKSKFLYLDVYKALFNDENGKIIGTVGCARIVTKERQMEKELRKNEEKMRSLFENSPYAILVTDINAKICDCNQTALDINGISSKDKLTGKNIIDLISNKDKQRIMESIKKLTKQNYLRYEEYMILAIDGREFHGEISANVTRDSNGKPLYFIIIYRDITKRKKAEEERRLMMEQMQHVQKLESLGVLAGGIAHDFNNILMGVLGNADLVLNKLQLDSPIHKNIINIKTAAKRAAGLCDQMLTYSGKCQTTIQSLNLNQVIEEMAQLLKISISKKSILKCSFADNLPPVKGDATQISQVAMNLITNASEALGDKGGVITISTGCKEYNSAYLNKTFLGKELLEGAYVFLEVSDNGCGIDKEKISKIFDPFFSTKFTGRGLGLAAVLGIVKGHGGTLDIKSEIGKGTTFRVLFPCSNSPVNKIVEKKHNFKDWQIGGSILVIDDEEDICSVAKDMLELIGFKVITANDGQNAIKIFRQNTEEIVLVLLDMTMPYMSGEEVFNEIRKIKSKARIIISSGYNEYNIKKHFADMELDGFIKKPYQLEALKEIVYEVLTQKNELQVEHPVYN